MNKIYNTGWKRARDRASLSQFRVHDLRHTFGYHIRALGIEEMDRKDLMGHKNGGVSRLHCKPSIEHLCAQAETLVTVGSDPVLKVVGN